MYSYIAWTLIADPRAVNRVLGLTFCTNFIIALTRLHDNACSSHTNPWQHVPWGHDNIHQLSVSLDCGLHVYVQKDKL